MKFTVIPRTYTYIYIYMYIYTCIYIYMGGAHPSSELHRLRTLHVLVPASAVYTGTPSSHPFSATEQVLSVAKEFTEEFIRSRKTRLA
jgi:hypothetical protein